MDEKQLLQAALTTAREQREQALAEVARLQRQARSQSRGWISAHPYSAVSIAAGVGAGVVLVLVMLVA